MSSATPRPQHFAQCAATRLQTGPGTGRYKTSRTRLGARDSTFPEHQPCWCISRPWARKRRAGRIESLVTHDLGSVSPTGDEDSVLTTQTSETSSEPQNVSVLLPCVGAVRPEPAVSFPIHPQGMRLWAEGEPKLASNPDSF
jgi:hypothetical protein